MQERLRARLLAGLATTTLGLLGCSTTSPTASGPPVASGIGVVSGSAQTAVIGSALSLPLVVHVTDQYGDPIANIPVTFSATTNATLGSTSGTTDASGDAQTTVSFNTTVAGLDTVTAAVSGVPVPARFFVTALATAPVSDSITGGNNQAGISGTALTLPLAVQVKDQYGNLVVGDTVTWTSSTGTVLAPTSVTDITGTAQMIFTPALGTDSVTAAIGGSALTAIFTETGT